MSAEHFPDPSDRETFYAIAREPGQETGRILAEWIDYDDANALSWLTKNPQPADVETAVVGDNRDLWPFVAVDDCETEYHHYCAHLEHLLSVARRGGLPGATRHEAGIRRIVEAIISSGASIDRPLAYGIETLLESMAVDIADTRREVLEAIR
jgi:hypothetical protein